MTKLEKLMQELKEREIYDSVIPVRRGGSQYVLAREGSAYDLFLAVDNHGDDGEHELSEAQQEYNYLKETYSSTRGFVYNGTSVRGLNG